MAGPLEKEKITMKMVRTALTAALIGGLSLGGLSLQAATSPYHHDRLPNGQITGLIAPDANAADAGIYLSGREPETGSA
jgi:hypothetical protein